MSAFPKSVIIVGAGAFGLSTALTISTRYPATSVTVIDRLTPPVKDGTSVDTSRILRPDYVDSEYERLADQAQDIFRNDPELQPYYFEHGFSFVVDGEPGEFDTLWRGMLENIKAKQPQTKWAELNSPEEVFKNLHGEAAELVLEEQLGRKGRWNKGYTSKRCATVNAEAIIKVYYDRCRANSNIHFVLGTPVDSLLYGSENNILGVVMETGRQMLAERTILATGAWSSRLVKLEGVMTANAVDIAYIKLTDEEYETYKHMGCHTNLVTGVNIFTPICGLLKILRRGAGIRNTTVLKDPEDRGATYKASYPRTAVDDSAQTLPYAIEKELRDEMREILPQFADRPFARTRLCWLEQTTNGDFLICPHPRFKGLHMATGGSLHGWKFLPLLGEFVVDSITKQLSPQLVEKWSWESKLDAKLGKFGFMVPGDVQELREITNGRAKL